MVVERMKTGVEWRMKRRTPNLVGFGGLNGTKWTLGTRHRNNRLKLCLHLFLPILSRPAPMQDQLLGNQKSHTHISWNTHTH